MSPMVNSVETPVLEEFCCVGKRHKGSGKRGTNKNKATIKGKDKPKAHKVLRQASCHCMPLSKHRLQNTINKAKINQMPICKVC